MKTHFAIRRLLAILMIAGLALAPASRPVMAATPSQAPHEMVADEMTPPETASQELASSDMSPDMMDEMAGGMPCCPSKAPMPVGCDKCVLMAACGAIGFPALSTTVSHPFPILSDTMALQRNDATRDGFGRPPPEHPPRRLV